MSPRRRFAGGVPLMGRGGVSDGGKRMWVPGCREGGGGDAVLGLKEWGRMGGGVREGSRG